MSSSLKGRELSYPTINKQAYVVYKELKYFRPYILKAHNIVFVPRSAVRTLFVQQELCGKRENWMTSLQEYDLEFKRFHIINCYGLCKLASKAIDSPKQHILWWE